MTNLSLAFQPPLPQHIWQTWNWDPLLLLTLLLVGTVYFRGLARLWRSAGAGRAVTHGQSLAFACGWLALLVALVSPLDAMGSALLSAHMVQHLLLTLFAAPLLVYGASPVALAWGLPGSRELARWWHKRVAERIRNGLQRIWRALSRPGVGWAVHLFVLWFWHFPALYQAALLDERVHIVEHTTFLGAALLFWWAVLNGRPSAAENAVRTGRPGAMRQTAPSGKRRRAGRLHLAHYVFTTALLSGLLGVLLTFSKSVWYPFYGIVPYGWGLTPLQDQQLAGVIMWFPGGLVYLLALLLLLRTDLQRRGPREGSDDVIVAPRRPLKMQN